MSELLYNYPRNCWWVAASTGEIGRTPLARWLLDEPVVLYRLRDGRAVALEDRCPHRWAPLSAGQVVEDRLICRYHGAQFGPDGMCVKVPSQNSVPPKACVKSYPIVEQNGYVWIWMGDPAAADNTPPPTLEFSAAEGWGNMSGFMEVACNYFLLQENVLDLTHFPYLHADTLEQEGWDTGLSDVKVADGQVTYRKDVTDSPIAPFIGLPMGITPDQTCDRVDWGTFVLPSTHIAGIDLQYGDVQATDGTNDLKFRISHLTTPQSAGQTHYWWVVGLNFGELTEATVATITEILEVTFAQDKSLLENIQRVVDHDHRGVNAPEVSFIADRPGLQARRILTTMLAAEGAPDSRGLQEAAERTLATTA